MKPALIATFCGLAAFVAVDALLRLAGMSQTGMVSSNAIGVLVGLAAVWAVRARVPD